MPLQIGNFISTSVVGQPKTINRIFSISPSWSGSSTINIDANPMNIGVYGTYTLVPMDTFTASVKMWGAGGSGFPSIGNGSGGGFSSGTMSFVKDQPYVVVVGQGGSLISGSVGPRTIGGGGYGRDTTVVANVRGGGLSGIFSGSYLQNNAKMVAGGGAGGRFANQVRQGAGGGVRAQNGYSTSNSIVAIGATTSSAGYQSGSVSTNAGGPLLGALGPATSFSAAGGGGYFGGGAHSEMGSGGSGYISNDVTGNTYSGSHQYPAFYTDPLNGGAGYPGLLNVSASNGRVIIY